MTAACGMAEERIAKNIQSVQEEKEEKTHRKRWWGDMFKTGIVLLETGNYGKGKLWA